MMYSTIDRPFAAETEIEIVIEVESPLTAWMRRHEAYLDADAEIHCLHWLIDGACEAGCFGDERFGFRSDDVLMRLLAESSSLAWLGSATLWRRFGQPHCVVAQLPELSDADEVALEALAGLADIVVEIDPDGVDLPGHRVVVAYCR
ncbi:hypothetical protein PTQ19_12010 [Microbacterium esteraromaticum]|uniref:hypothetical protein n=1 Tax=Microbacterium esteraromaticum TaxID=57043 RepID=UPI0023683795|nr:hypothetical protein [Microbacterium esteraromaticum]WDH78235.1 hypothetical protein PTQ19_12010 [Microbacterium esteraromaticum]